MDPKTAFDQFETRGAGLLPVIALSLLAFVATVAVVHLTMRLDDIDEEGRGGQLINAEPANEQEIAP